MNNARRKKLNEIRAELQDLMIQLDLIKDEEQESFDNMNRIIVKHGVSKKLQKIFGISAPSVRRALNWKLDGKLSEEKAKRIRKCAIENGGVEMVIIEKGQTLTL